MLFLRVKYRYLFMYTTPDPTLQYFQYMIYRFFIHQMSETQRTAPVCLADLPRRQPTRCKTETLSPFFKKKKKKIQLLSETTGPATFMKAICDYLWSSMFPLQNHFRTLKKSLGAISVMCNNKIQFQTAWKN